jgi:hypothetical protein
MAIPSFLSIMLLFTLPRPVLLILFRPAHEVLEL